MIPDKNAVSSFVVDGDFCRWHWTATDIQFELRSNVLQRISHDLLRKNPTQRPNSVGGLLLGKSYSRAPMIFRVMEVEPCESADLHSVLTILTHRLTSSVESGAFPKEFGSVLGFYRIAAKDDSAFSKLDMNLARTCFYDPRKVFLILQPSDSVTAAGSLFFWDHGELRPVPLEFPMAEGEQGKATPSSWPDTPDRASGEQLLGSDISSKRHFTARTIGLAVAIAAGLVTATLVSVHPRSNDRALPPVSSMGMPLETTVIAVEDRLWLSWDKRAAALASAKIGLAIIRDGAHRKELVLDRTQLLEGGVFYKAESPTVSFTLQIFGEGLSESVALQPDPPLVKAPPPILADTKTLVPPALVRPRQIAESRPEAAVTHSGAVSPKSALAQATLSDNASAQIVKDEPTLQVTHSSSSAVTSPPVTNERAETPLRPAAPTPEDRRDMVTQAVSPSPTVPIVESPPPATPSQVPPTLQSSSAATGAQFVLARVPPQPLRQAKPLVPPGMRALISRQILVIVTLDIDADGRIIRAKAPSTNGVLETSLAKLAIETARLWKFRPAREGERNVPGEIQIQFQFSPGRQ